MKTIQSLIFAAVALVGATVSADPKQLYHITAPKSVFDETVAKFHGELDVWSVKAVDSSADKITADVYATDAEISFFEQHSTRAVRFGNETIVERDEINTQELLAVRAVQRATCAKSTSRHLEELATSATYVSNAFFDCFRQSSEIFALLDSLVSENPSFFSKINKVSTTVNGQSIPAYKISTGSGRKPLYTQGLIHAREWIAGSSTLYVMAGFLDGLRSGDATVKAIFDKYDWYFVPVLNIDGYQYSWSNDRMWRKNRKKVSGSTYGVDLNRNFPPNSYWGKGGDGPSSDAYPGSSVLSEPESSGIWSYLKTLNPYGAIDMHSYAGQILRAYGNKQGTPPAPIGPKLKVLGDAMAKAAGSSYVSQTSAQLYVAYGCFDDAVFQELGKPTFTIEMAGSSFIASESTIRSAGKQMYNAFVAFANGIETYWSGL